MIQIQDVSYSKNPLSINETFLFYVTLVEIFSNWNDLTEMTWDSLETRTWEDIRRKIF